mgnify:CR=1 FL=1
MVFLPLVQKQWLNLYLFNIDNFSIYKVLYYLSGLIIPILVTTSSLKKFTYYKFIYHTKNNDNNNINNFIKGKFLLLIFLIISIILSIFISRYIFINLKIILSLFISNNEYLNTFFIDKQILFVIIISTFLLFKKTKFILKKIILINYFLISIVTWYSQINNLFLIDIVPFNIFKFGNINFINLSFLLAIEIGFYLWSYISYSSYLSDWKLPKPNKEEILPILNIVMFYLLIILNYSLLFK